jgi:hypothetical protein
MENPKPVAPRCDESHPKLLHAARLAANRPAPFPPTRVIHVMAPPKPCVPEPVFLAAKEVADNLDYDLLAGGLPPSYGELMALLYARAYPMPEWPRRVSEALTGARL